MALTKAEDVIRGAAVNVASTTNLGKLKVAQLPPATQATNQRYIVSDSTVAAATNFGATVVGGGSNPVPVVSNGTNWIIG